MPSSDMHLAGRLALITGASRREGIGAAVCRALAAAGANVFFTHWREFDRAMPQGADRGGPDLLQDELVDSGVHATSLELDLSDPDAPRELLDAVETWGGVPDILVNNAAYSYSSETIWQTLDAASLDAHYAVNVRATSLLSVEFARRRPDRPGGRIINLTSGQSLGPMPGELAYATTKGAVEALTVTLAAALAPRLITVNAVNPGPTDTGWMTDDLKRELLPRFPTGRIGQPEDAARLITFLASDDAAWITGQIMHSEGGFQRW